MSNSIYERLGPDAITAAVDLFYVKMLSDDRVSRFFEGVDMRTQKRKQAQFLSYVFGGPEQYKGKDMRAAHLHLIRDKGLSMDHFDATAENFVATLNELNVPQDIIDQATGILLSTRKHFEPLTPEEEAQSTATPAKQNLFQKLGPEAIKAAVDLFYSKMLSDERVNIFFDGVDMRKQKAKQAQFLSYVFGGPEDYKGKDMRAAHLHLIRDKGLSLTHFDITAEHFVATLKELSVPQDAIDEATDILLSTRKYFEPLTPEEAHTSSKPSLYERLGADAITAAVDVFYQKMLGDQRVARFFEGVDMRAQKRKQAQFLSYVFGGPENYKGKDMRAAHLHLIRDKGLDMTHFDITAEHFVATLKQLSVPQDSIDDAVAILLSTRKYFEPLTSAESAGCPVKHGVDGKDPDQVHMAQGHCRGCLQC